MKSGVERWKESGLKTKTRNSCEKKENRVRNKNER